jgi:GNAT superfamily N-acetyltransferase
MSVEIREVGPEALAEYAKVPIRFRVSSLFRVEGAGETPGTFRLVEEPVETPCVKDYDAIKGEGPMRWANRFDVKNWAFFIAWDGDEPIGAAAVAFDTPGVNMLEGRRDLAALWDLRVRPDRRGEGIGTQLFRRACEWARGRGCSRLKIETQNTNVRACRFYMNQGCRLERAVRNAYPPPLEDEVMLLWTLDL